MSEAVAGNDMRLWYPRPAAEWLEALPLGNGRLGAMDFGGTDTERLQLNEDTLWAGGPHEDANPDGLAALPEIRRLVFAERWREAQELIDARFLSRPVRQMPYQPVGDLRLTFPGGGAVKGYRRELDLEQAVTTVAYTRDGVGHRREAFASFPDQVVVLRLVADRPGQVSFTATFESPQDATVSSPDRELVTLDGVSGTAQGLPGQVRFQALARVLVEGGRVESAGGTVSVRDADAAVVLVSIGTSYRDWRDAGGDPSQVAAGHLAEAAARPYEELRQRHVADYRDLFRRTRLELPATEAAARPTDERVSCFAGARDPQLVALYYHYGRYLLISSSRAGCQPANLQGLWNELMDPPWESKYTININTEMNYWPVASANLLECWEPLFALLDDLADAGRSTARTMYGAPGWVAHHNTDGWRGTAPVDGAFWGMWPTGGAWLSLAILEHFRFTGDLKTLRRRFPVLRDAAEFFLAALVEDPSSGRLVTCPSISPENAHHHSLRASVCAGPTMDLQILRDLFDACAEASRQLDEDNELVDRVLAARGRLAPMKVGPAGQLQEWQQDWDATAEPGHRHVSHLYGLHPSNQITGRGTPELAAAARTTLEQRGDAGTGWSLAWKINFWARLEDGARAYRLLSELLTPERTAPNLFDLHPPFQIDGNFGATAGIVELLLQSHAGELHLLPALPPDLPSGRVRGLLGRGGFEVDIEWRDGALWEATISSRLGGPVTVRAPDAIAVEAGPVVETHDPAVAAEAWSSEGGTAMFDTRAGVWYRIHPVAASRRGCGVA